MDTQEKTLVEQLRSLRIATYRYLRGQYRKAAEETSKESRKKIMENIFACLSEEEQKTMGSYLDRIVEALKSETKESDDYDVLFDKDPMDFVRLLGFYRHMGGFGHGSERMNGFMMPF
jgi:hypothetical protein